MRQKYWGKLSCTVTWVTKANEDYKNGYLLYFPFIKSIIIGIRNNTNQAITGFMMTATSNENKKTLGITSVHIFAIFNYSLLFQSPRVLSHTAHRPCCLFLLRAGWYWLVGFLF